MIKFLKEIYANGIMTLLGLMPMIVIVTFITLTIRDNQPISSAVISGDLPLLVLGITLVVTILIILPLPLLVGLSEWLFEKSLEHPWVIAIFWLVAIAGFFI